MHLVSSKLWEIVIQNTKKKHRNWFCKRKKHICDSYLSPFLHSFHSRINYSPLYITTIATSNRMASVSKEVNLDEIFDWLAPMNGIKTLNDIITCTVSIVSCLLRILLRNIYSYWYIIGYPKIIINLRCKT